MQSLGEETATNGREREWGTIHRTPHRKSKDIEPRNAIYHDPNKPTNSKWKTKNQRRRETFIRRGKMLFEVHRVHDGPRPGGSGAPTKGKKDRTQTTPTKKKGTKLNCHCKKEESQVHRVLEGIDPAQAKLEERRHQRCVKEREEWVSLPEAIGIARRRTTPQP